MLYIEKNNALSFFIDVLWRDGTFKIRKRKTDKCICKIKEDFYEIINFIENPSFFKLINEDHELHLYFIYLTNIKKEKRYDLIMNYKYLNEELKEKIRIYFNF